MLAILVSLPMLLATQLGWSRVGAAAEVPPIAAQPPFDDLEAKATPTETYAANAFAIVTVTGGGGHWHPVRGIYRISTEYDAFFHAIGRDDLAQRFSRRQTTGAVLKALGYLSMAGALVLGGWALSEDETLPAIGGGILLVGWLALDNAGTRMRKPELSADQALDMAGQYNEALRAKLQLSRPSDDRRIKSATRRPAPPMLLPAIAPSGGGLVLVGAF
jgi:hypothetical protein